MSRRSIPRSASSGVGDRGTEGSRRAAVDRRVWRMGSGVVTTEPCAAYLSDMRRRPVQHDTTREDVHEIAGDGAAWRSSDHRIGRHLAGLRVHGFNLVNVHRGIPASRGHKKGVQRQPDRVELP